MLRVGRTRCGQHHTRIASSRIETLRPPHTLFPRSFRPHSFQGSPPDSHSGPRIQAPQILGPLTLPRSFAFLFPSACGIRHRHQPSLTPARLFGITFSASHHHPARGPSPFSLPPLLHSSRGHPPFTRPPVWLRGTAAGRTSLLVGMNDALDSQQSHLFGVRKVVSLWFKHESLGYRLVASHTFSPAVLLSPLTAPVALHACLATRNSHRTDVRPRCSSLLVVVPLPLPILCDRRPLRAP